MIPQSLVQLRRMLVVIAVTGRWRGRARQRGGRGRRVREAAEQEWVLLPRVSGRGPPALEDQHFPAAGTFHCDFVVRPGLVRVSCVVGVTRMPFKAVRVRQPWARRRCVWWVPGSSPHGHVRHVIDAPPPAP
jgi:hypothetical protein